MNQNNFSISLRKTHKINVDKTIHSLPPDLGPFEELRVAEYFCPDEWSKDGVFIRVEEGQPFWFDLRDNWDCAVLCSIQKINPVTGEQVDLSKGLFKDLKQNYLRLPEQLWLDGYSNDGKVYQFVITKSGIKVAVNEYVLPEYEQDSHAMAFAFFNAKIPKQKPNYSSGVSAYLQTLKATYPVVPFFRGVGSAYDSNTVKQSQTICQDNASPQQFSPLPQNFMCASKGITGQCIAAAYEEASMDIQEEVQMVMYDTESQINNEPEKEFEKVSMAAGGRIEQLIVPDNNTIDYYFDKPSAILMIYFAFSDQFNHIINQGKRNSKKKDKYINSGAISGIQVPLV